jgi:hypothetical protein
VFGGASLLVLIWLAVSGPSSMPLVRLPHTLREAFWQAATVLEWASAGIMVVGAVGELLARRWGRQLVLIAAATWVAASLASFAWTVLLELTRHRGFSGLITARWTSYATMLLNMVNRSAYPLMLLVCLRWPELRDASAARGSAAFQPIMPPVPSGRTVGSEGPA